MQPFYGNLRQDVETVLCSPSVDSSSTIAVSPVKSIRIGWRSLILFTVEMIRDADGTMDDETEDDATDDAAGDDATNNVAVEVDNVVDKLLDNAIEAYGSSPRDVMKQSPPRLSPKQISLKRCRARRTMASAILSCVFNRSSLPVTFRTPSFKCR